MGTTNYGRKPGGISAAELRNRRLSDESLARAIENSRGRAHALFLAEKSRRERG